MPTLYAATEDVPGDSFVGPNGCGYAELVHPSRASQDLGLAQRLWARLAELTHVEPPAPIAG